MHPNYHGWNRTYGHAGWTKWRRNYWYPIKYLLSTSQSITTLWEWDFSGGVWDWESQCGEVWGLTWLQWNDRLHVNWEARLCWQLGDLSTWSCDDLMKIYFHRCKKVVLPSGMWHSLTSPMATSFTWFSLINSSTPSRSCNIRAR